jgi:GWxTD domain-containing protein
MTVSRVTSALIVLATLAAAATAEKLDPESRKWLDGVAAIILSDEAKVYGQLKDRAERQEFEKIFWARRDPDLRTAANEAEQTFLARKAEADQRFAVTGLAGSATGCGRLLILLGEPDAVRDNAMGAMLGVPGGGASQARTGVERSSANEVTQLPTRTPQVWVYKDRRDMVFTGGTAEVSVDARCGIHPLVNASLSRTAAGRIMNPGLTYKVTAGRLTRLADLMPKPTPAQKMIESGRKDFAVAGQAAFARAEGATAVLGLERAQAADLAGPERAPARTAPVTIAAYAVAEDGQIAAVDERAVTAPVDESGGVLVSYRLFLRPGGYTLRYGLLDAKTGRGASGSQPIDVPDLAGPDLSVASLLVVKDIVEGATGNPAEPLDAFVLGGLKLLPRFQNAFTRGETAHFFYGVNGSTDDATGKADLTTGFSILKGAQVVADTPKQSFADAHVVTSVGPVELAFEPGAYTARLKVKDNRTKREMTVDEGFTIK